MVDLLFLFIAVLFLLATLGLIAIFQHLMR
jgi:hypothetical protein